MQLKSISQRLQSAIKFPYTVDCRLVVMRTYYGVRLASHLRLTWVA